MAKAKRRKPRTKLERPPADESKPVTSDKPKPRRPWWLIGTIAALVGIIAYVQITSGLDREADEGGDVALEAAPAPPESLVVRVVHRYPHDPGAFTQGLLWHDGYLYESTGLRGQSSLRRVDLESGEVLERRSVDSRLFAEGLARVGDELIQLTWQSGEAHVWSLDGFEHRRQFSYDGEGWGLCYDGVHLVMSDGSERLTFREPHSFRVDHVVRVRDADGYVQELNELECVDGVVWANVWETDRIVRIDPVTGRVTANVDVSGLLAATERWDADVLNGIAWIEERGHFVITGKLWPWLYEVDFVSADE